MLLFCSYTPCAQDRWHDSERLQHHAITLLARLCTDQNSAKQLVTAGALRYSTSIIVRSSARVIVLLCRRLCGLADHHTSNTVLMTALCITLSHIALNVTCQAKLISEGPLSRLLTLLEKQAGSVSTAP